MQHDIRKFSKEKILVSPSLLAADFSSLAAEVCRVEEAGCELLHLDIMDGHFVPNLTMGPALIGALRKHSNLLFDVHFMITDPMRYIEPFVKAGADHITFHIEADGDPVKTIEAIHAAGCTAGITLKPGTPASTLEKVLPLVEMVLVMTVEPGFGGQSFRADQLPKAKEIYEMLRKIGSPALIEADGGVAEATAPGLAEAGVSVLVAGTSVFRHPAGAPAAIAELRKAERFLPGHA